MDSYPTRVSSKGQVVIPVGLREQLGLEKGAHAVWREERGRLILIPIKSLLDELQGCLKPKPGQPSMIDELLAERRREREHEDKKL
jgi:AbrB family looped-hinge helix DNA binding protein